MVVNSREVILCKNLIKRYTYKSIHIHPVKAVVAVCKSYTPFHKYSYLFVQMCTFVLVIYWYIVKVPVPIDLLFFIGLYVSRDISKAQAYGQVIFKLLVYPGGV